VSNDILCTKAAQSEFGSILGPAAPDRITSVPVFRPHAVTGPLKEGRPAYSRSGAGLAAACRRRLPVALNWSAAGPSAWGPLGAAGAAFAAGAVAGAAVDRAGAAGATAPASG